MNSLGLLKFRLYKMLWQPVMAARLRHRKEIKAVFVLHDMSSWKTESLYLEMQKDKRFSPVIAITRSLNTPGEERSVIDYCNKRQYPFVMLEEGRTICSQLHPDILLYQKPYGGVCPPEHAFYANMRSLFIYVTYAFHSHLHRWAVDQDLMRYSWFLPFENRKLAEEYRSAWPGIADNICATGLPMMDDLINGRKSTDDPWKDSSGKKRIIYAPHHTIGDMHIDGIAFSTFLENGEFILEMAEKYKDQVHFAFKPHPLLRKNLEMIWGKERTDAYYREWETRPYTQFENGSYVDLFNKSDAMIHDCSSFTVEYHYTQNPVMYLMREDNKREKLSSLTTDAFNLSYHGYSHADIESFVQDVIAGKDTLKDQRQDFYNECLLPPGGQTACRNIIDRILSK